MQSSRMCYRKSNRKVRQDMKEEIYIHGRDYEATATYDDGKVIIHVGSQLKYTNANGFRHNEQAFSMRENKEFVKEGVVIKECIFESPSTAAQFITGGSRNGYDTWKLKKGYSLGQFLQDKGVRERKVRKKEQ